MLEVTVRIGELAEASGVSVRSLRYYEEQGLLGAERTSGGQRRYPGEAVERVAWIRRLLAAGLSGPTIREFVPCFEHTGVTEATRARLRAERDRLDAYVAELVATRERLDALIVASDHPESCADVA